MPKCASVLLLLIRAPWRASHVLCDGKCTLHPVNVLLLVLRTHASSPGPHYHRPPNLVSLTSNNNSDALCWLARRPALQWSQASSSSQSRSRSTPPARGPNPSPQSRPPAPPPPPANPGGGSQTSGICREHFAPVTLSPTSTQPAPLRGRVALPEPSKPGALHHACCNAPLPAVLLGQRCRRTASCSPLPAPAARSSGLPIGAPSVL